MRILMISGMFYPKVNGSVVAVSNMMRSLSERGIQVTLVTRRERGSFPVEVKERARIVRVGRPGYALWARALLALQLFVAAAKEARANRPDAIHVHGFTSLIAGAALGVSIRRPVVVSFHGIQRLWSAQARWRSKTTLSLTFPLETMLVATASGVLAQSNRLRDVVIGLYKVDPDRIVVVPNPIDVSTFSYGSPTGLASPLVLFVGSLVRVHGPDLLVEAFPAILHDHPGARLVIAGKGPLLRVLTDRINELQLADSVDLLDEVKDVKELSRIYKDSRVVVLPLRYTGYILSLVGEEAMASGRPVVTTMMLDDELRNFGVLQTSAHEGSLEKAVNTVLSWDESRYQATSLQARRFAEDNFSLGSVGARLESIYKHAIFEFVRARR